MSGFFVTGIGTDIGKTVVSAILVEALKADYWKPIQSGNLDYTDTDFIRDYTIQHQTLHNEGYVFTEPVSPHLAAELESKQIDIQYLNLPKSNNYMIVEGAGGLLVPLNSKYLIIDLISKLQFPVILVSPTPACSMTADGAGNGIGCCRGKVLAANRATKNY